MGSDCATGRQALETIFSSVSDHQELEHSEFEHCVAVRPAETQSGRTSKREAIRAADKSREDGRPNYRLRRNLAEAAALAVGTVVLIWTLVPIYNIVSVALEPHGDVFTNDIWPAKPSLESFWVVISQGHWYLEYFWEQFGNSLYIGVATVVLTLLIGSLASFSIGRMRIRHGWL
jgi:ABC-type Fe3+ transport system permease subunit